MLKREREREGVLSVPDTTSLGARFCSGNHSSTSVFSSNTLRGIKISPKNSAERGEKRNVVESRETGRLEDKRDYFYHHGSLHQKATILSAVPEEELYYHAMWIHCKREWSRSDFRNRK